MSNVRRDNKGRILRIGESQRKDGRYAYKYKDNRDAVRFAYSWMLNDTDPLPAGKRRDISLREKERRIAASLVMGEVLHPTVMDVSALIDRYIRQKTTVRRGTLRVCNYVSSLISNDSFGKCRIRAVTRSDAREWIISLDRQGLSYGTIRMVFGVVRPAFRMAVEDDLIRKNPFSFRLSDLLINNSIPRTALTAEQEAAFLDFIRDDPHYSRYYEGVCILFGTGLRISEFAGLTRADISLTEQTLCVRRQLLRLDGGALVTERVKTAHAERTIPMSDEVTDCFRRLIQAREVRLRNPSYKEPRVGALTGFFYYDRNGRPLTASNWQKYFRNMRDKYNRTHDIPLPVVTPHTCRHTFCTRMVHAGMHPKVLQTIMGHSSITITLDIYTHISRDKASIELGRVLSGCTE